MRLTMCARCGPVMSSSWATRRACASWVSQVLAVVSVLTAASTRVAGPSMLGPAAAEDLSRDGPPRRREVPLDGEHALVQADDRDGLAAHLGVVPVLGL